MTQQSLPSIIKSVPCFSELAADAQSLLLSSSREVHFATGKIILQEGEPCPGLFILISGSVKLFRMSSNGDEQIMRIIAHGGCFECAPLFDHGPNPVSAQVLEAGSAVFIPSGSFQAMVAQYPEVTLKLVPILTMRLRDLLNTVEDFSFKPVGLRINKLLLQMGDIVDTDMPSSMVPLTQNHLACIVGCSRQMLNNYLQQLAKNEIILIQKRRIIVLNPEALKEHSY